MAAAVSGSLQGVALGAEGKTPGRPKWLVTCRDAHLKEIGEADPWKALKTIGAEGMEVDVSTAGECTSLQAEKDPHTVGTPEGIRALRERLVQEKTRITAFCMHNHFDEREEEELAAVERVVRAALDLKVPAIRLDVVPRKLSDKNDEFLKFAVGVGKRLVKIVSGTPIRFGVENHGTTTNRPEFLRGLFEGVGSEQFGLTLDTANLYWFGHPLSELYKIYEAFGSRVCHTHCKNIRYPEAEREKKRPMGWEYGKYAAPVYEGDIDFKKVAAILRSHSYRGDLCIENEMLGRLPAAERGAVLKREVGFLRTVRDA